MLIAPLREHGVPNRREMVLFFLDRIDRLAEITHLERSVSEYVRSNVFVTPGGISAPAT
ncbi:MAG: hypothetical protein ACXWD3_16760 [Mycobacterium sp.]